jgi:hypothetical protein
MKTEIIVVIIASVASLIVGLINIFFNARISAKQNETELKKTRIDLLENRRQKIESIKTELSNRVIDVSDIQEFNFDIHFPRMINFFQQNSSNVYSIGHLIDQQFIKELKSLNQRINDYIAKSKQRIQIDENEAKIDIQKMGEMNDKIHDELDKSLVNIEMDINKLLK